MMMMVALVMMVLVVMITMICTNFLRVPGYKVYCCGQPTVAGFEAALNKVLGFLLKTFSSIHSKVCGETYPKTGKIIWINMRQEPDVYVNGEPVCARFRVIITSCFAC